MQSFAGVITGTLGWLGIPFGLLFAPWALFELARGGKQPSDLNATMLRELAERKAEAGNADAAIRCLEASLQFGQDEEVKKRISELRLGFAPAAEGGGRGRTLRSVVLLLLVAALLGTAIGAIDVTVHYDFSLAMGDESPIFLIVLSWTPMVAMAFVGGLVLASVLEWGLGRIRCCRLPLGIGAGTGAAFVTTYGFCQGSWMAYCVLGVLSGTVFGSAFEAAIFGILSVVAGGLMWLDVSFQFALSSLWDTIYRAALVGITVYLVAMGIYIGVRTVRWQRRLAAEPAYG
jgi:hypothetical protein